MCCLSRGQQFVAVFVQQHQPEEMVNRIFRRSQNLPPYTTNTFLNVTNTDGISHECVPHLGMNEMVLSTGYKTIVACALLFGHKLKGKKPQR
jgi:hypothetical protein